MSIAYDAPTSPESPESPEFRGARRTVVGGPTRRALVAGMGASAAALGALTACGVVPGGGPPAATGAPVTLSFLSWRPIAMEQFAPAWKEYERKHNVAFEIDPTGERRSDIGDAAIRDLHRAEDHLVGKHDAGIGEDQFVGHWRSLPLGPAPSEQL